MASISYASEADASSDYFVGHRRVLSLFCFAITINSAILIVAATSFYYRRDSSSEEGVGDLFDAYALIKEYVGKGADLLRPLACNRFGD